MTPGVWSSREYPPPRLLIDINVILDVVLERPEHLHDSAMVLSAVEYREAAGFVASHTITTAHYLIEKARDRRTASLSMAALLGIVEVVPLESTDFQQVFLLPIDDYEDAVQFAAALKIGADYLVTRNLRDYRFLPDENPRVRAPAEILAILSASR